MLVSKKDRYSCMVVEDDPISSIILKKYIDDKPYLSLDKVVDNAEDAHLHIQSNDLDLLFLDIELKDASGIDLMKRIGMDAPYTIVTTAHKGYALEAFSLPIYAYLVKPFQKEDIDRALDKFFRLTRKEEKAPEIFEFKTVKLHLKIAVDSILYVEAMKDYVSIYTKEGPEVLHMTMKRMEEILGSEKFMRISRSVIVSTTYITKITGMRIFVGQVPLKIGATQKEAVFQRLSELGWTRKVRD